MGAYKKLNPVQQKSLEGELTFRWDVKNLISAAIGNIPIRDQGCVETHLWGRTGLSLVEALVQLHRISDILKDEDSKIFDDLFTQVFIEQFPFISAEAFGKVRNLHAEYRSLLNKPPADPKERFPDDFKRYRQTLLDLPPNPVLPHLPDLKDPNALWSRSDLNLLKKIGTALVPHSGANAAQKPAAGLEETWQERLIRVANQMQAEGLIQSSKAFLDPFLKAGEYAQQQWDLSGPKGKDRLSKRLMVLDDLSRVLEQIFLVLPDKCSIRILRMGQRRDMFEAVLALPTDFGLLRVVITIRMDSKFPLTSIDFYRQAPGNRDAHFKEGNVRLGRDKVMDDRPPIHLDIDQGEGTWWYHKDLGNAWGEASTDTEDLLSAFHYFQEGFLQRIGEIPYEGPRFIKRQEFETRYTLEAGKIPPKTTDLLITPVPITVHLHWQEGLEPVITQLRLQERLVNKTFGNHVHLKYHPFKKKPALPFHQRPGIVLWNQAAETASPETQMPILPYKPDQSIAPKELLDLVFMALLERNSLTKLNLLHSWSFEAGHLRYSAAAFSLEESATDESA